MLSSPNKSQHNLPPTKLGGTLSPSERVSILHTVTKKDPNGHTILKDSQSTYVINHRAAHETDGDSFSVSALSPLPDGRLIQRVFSVTGFGILIRFTKFLISSNKKKAEEVSVLDPKASSSNSSLDKTLNALRIIGEDSR